MNYKKAYKEALERARSYYNTEEARVGMTPIDLEEIFPELAESEDERIRKSIIAIINNYVDNSNTFKPKMVDWLEKQKELTLDEEKQGKEDVLWCINQAKKHAKDENEMGTCWFAEKWLEKQGEQILAKSAKTCKDEQKSNGKVEPKFKVGDWIAYNAATMNNPRRIAGVFRDDFNYLYYKMHSIVESDDIMVIESKDFTDTNYHLWTIEDAKDGDVLVHNGHTFIFKGIEDGIVKGLCLEFSDSILNFGEPEYDNDYHPATKEQRETLFKAMHEAGYEWSSEHKKLIKNDACVALTKKMLYDIILDLKVFRDKDCSTEGKAAYQREIDWLENLKKELEE